MYTFYSDLVEERKAPISERKKERFSFCRIVGFFFSEINNLILGEKRVL